MDELIAISSMENAELAEFTEGIAAHLGVAIRLSRMSTSALIERLRDDTAGPWDLLLGTAASALLDPGLTACLSPLDELDVSTLPAAAVAQDRRWFSPSGFVPAFCYDPQVLAAYGIVAPDSWRALAAAHWCGRIALSDPARSGAGYLHLCALLDRYGDEAWALLGRLAALQPAISGSAIAPIDAVLSGRAWLGVSVSTAATRAALEHPRLRWCVPDDARCYEFEVFGCRAGSPQAVLAQQALGWMIGAPAQAISRRYGKVVVGADGSVGGLRVERLQALDVQRASQAKASRCAQWQALFSSAALQGETCHD